MPATQLDKQLTAFINWRKRQHRILDQLAPWLKQQGLFTAEVHRACERSLEALKNDTITIAVAGEFARGKTELINALFFADHGRRLLPTNAGRTTMCPTEIFQDDSEAPFLRLLPIETRRLDTSLHKLRDAEDHWVSYPLDLDDPVNLEQQLLHLTASRKVPVRDAIALGLYRTEYAENTLADHELVSIPKWRLAQVNFRHPLLAQGLRLLDTPGLNAVGNEPELTYEILPNAQAILFVLAADTGVTRSDLDIWQQVIKRPGANHSPSVMVVLNKTDTLWDELRQPHDIKQSIENQCQNVARVLDIERSQIFAASAQKGLLARLNHNAGLEQRTGLPMVESYLSETMVRNRRDLIMSEYTEAVRSALTTLGSILDTRAKRTQKQLNRLQEMNGQSDTVITHMLQETQREKVRYQASIDAYQDSRKTFLRRGHTMMEALNLDTFDAIVNQARQQMTGAWTTLGLKEAMRILFEDIQGRMETISNQTQSMRRLIRTIYRRFQTDHEFPAMQPAMFSIVKHQVELGLLQQEAEVFRNSARTVMTEQHFVVSRYFRTIVHRARKIFEQAHEEAQHWLNESLSPLTLAIQENRGAINQQLRDLKQAHKSRENYQSQFKTLQRQQEKLRIQLKSLANVNKALGNPAMPLPHKNSETASTAAEPPQAQASTA